MKQLRLKNTWLLCLIVLPAMLFGQRVERKIIIENGQYYYITVDDNWQIGTLYQGEVTAPLKNARAMALPAGRNSSAQTNPLAWDVDGKNLYAVSFLDHPLNDRMEAIKQIELDQLKPWNAEVEVGNMVMQSIDQTMYAYNQPYWFAKQRSDYLNHFYFDGIMIGNAYWMVVTNNGEITVWNCHDKEWKHGEVGELPVTGFFSLFEWKNEPYLITEKGAIYQIGEKQLTAIGQIEQGIFLKDITLIEDRDNNEILYIKNTQLNQEESIEEVLNKAGVKLMNKG